MSFTENAYKKHYLFEGTSDYYIHKHQQNIGAASGEGDSKIINYKDQKEAAWNAAKSYYKTLFVANISDAAVGLTEEAFKTDDVLTELNKQMQTAVQNALRPDKIYEGLNQQKVAAYGGDNWVGEHIRGRDTQNALAAFDRVLGAVAKTCDLVQSKYGDSLAIALIQLRNTKGLTLRQKGSRLLAELDKFAILKNGKTFEEQQVYTVVQKLESFAKGVLNPRKGTADKITKIVESIFNTSFAEGFGAMLRTDAVTAINRYTSRAITGAKNTHITFTDEFGRIVTDNYGDEKDYKTDTRLENVTMEVAASDHINKGQITFNLGLSNKQYRKAAFPAYEEVTKKTEIHGGKSGRIKEALDSLFGVGTSRQKYLGYNYLTWYNQRDQLGVEIEELSDLIATRQLIRIFASRGGIKDFSQFMLVNGQIIPIWNILQQMKEASIDGIVSLEIEGLPSDPESYSILEQYTRMQQLNTEISTAVISATLHLDKLKGSAFEWTKT